MLSMIILLWIYYILIDVEDEDIISMAVEKEHRRKMLDQLVEAALKYSTL